MSTAILPTYARADIAFVAGEGPWLEATDGRRFLDFASGVAVNVAGHAHPHLVAALTEQAQKLWHTSNLFRIPGQERLAERLTAATFADRVFFCNSGAEALEGAIKTARRYFHVSGQPERFRLITFTGAFHGRTLATIAAGGNAAHMEGFGPKMDGFDHVPFGDLQAVEAAIGPATAGILIEPVQGEGGINIPPAGFLKGLRALADRHGLLLLMDEVQTGMGRTGRLFAHEHFGVTPDIMAIAKGIGGGFPLGAFMATEEAAKGMTAGTHGSTFGGNPLGTAVGNAVLDLVLADGFLDEVSRKASLFRQAMAEVADDHPQVIAEVRGLGLLTGVRCADGVKNADLVAALREEEMLGVYAGSNVVRLLPPLNIDDADLVEAAKRLGRACARLAGGS
ncbi:aspartate aminotransferase family protein [Marinibaculum pumilum]|uniref:Acetylornithine aminotransferase n=1 Tax=Marinibaculum pumilum TaxID=1766165 RepID=A0ABV7L889_9PROT